MTVITSTPQDLTGAWADLGSVITTTNFTKMAVWLDIDINSSLDVRFRALARYNDNGTDEYNLMIKSISSSTISVEPEYIEFTNDVDQKSILLIDVTAIPFVQLQVMAGTVGGTAGQIESSKYTIGYGS